MKKLFKLCMPLVLALAFVITSIPVSAASLKEDTLVDGMWYGSKKITVYSKPGTKGTIKIGNDKYKFKTKRDKKSSSDGKAVIKLKKVYKLNTKVVYTAKYGDEKFTFKDKMDSYMTGECCTPDNWAALARLLCSLVPFANQSPSKEVTGHIIKEAPTCLPKYFASVVQRDSYEMPDVPWKS